MARPHLLLVDDEPQLLHACEARLASAGFMVTTCSSGHMALARLGGAHGFDLLLLDLNMPGMDGLQVMRELRQTGVDIPVVALSGDTSFEWVSGAFQLGACDYVIKPCDYDSLINTINNALQKRAMQQSLQQLRRRLERTERLHRFMIESSPDLIFIVDRSGNFAFVNERAEELLGYRKDELIGEHYSVVTDPESLPKVELCLSEHRNSARAARLDEVWLLCKPGLTLRGERRRIGIEMTAMAVYENDASGPGKQNRSEFSGTYVVARDITERLASQKLLHYQAYHDLLTGLPNRALFLDRLGNAISSARRSKEPLAVLLLGLDRFKVINDSLGHELGDLLLTELAARLSACLRESDTLARFGGDEFSVLLPKLNGAEGAQIVANKILAAVKQPFVLQQHEVYVTVSIGIALYPDDGVDADTLIKHADMAMYQTKEQGKNGFNIYSRELSEQQRQQLSLESEIRRGLREGQFVPYYQPQVNTADGRICGVEALLRWQHPERGVLKPSYFLPVAEASGLIVELGKVVLAAALADFSEWRRSGIELERLALNFSAREIAQPEFVEQLLAALAEQQLSPALFEIEVTESTLIVEAGQHKHIAQLRQLREQGISIAVDDFGSGYTSLSLLQQLPINRLKIDRSFIQQLDADGDRAILEAVAHLARGLKLELVVEGVENEAQLSYLRQLQCPVVQGYLYSHGLPAPELRRILEIKGSGFLIGSAEAGSRGQVS
jgi:diguanylate cyclase (GGDEF)-like protein/PAS domain S-box-containing protein